MGINFKTMSDFRGGNKPQGPKGKKPTLKPKQNKLKPSTKGFG